MIVFKNQIEKSTARGRRTANRLQRLLNSQEPGLVRVLCALWEHQIKDVTYQDIQEALQSGDITEDTIEQWRQDYAGLISEDMLPVWIATIEAAQKELLVGTTGLYVPSYDSLISWTQDRAANLVVDITESQRTALQGVIQRAMLIEDQPPQELAMAIRPIIGLYPQQATANFRYYQRIRQTLIDSGSKPEKAAERARVAANKYAGKQHRYRAQMIARTEICAAYNQSEQGGVKQAIEEGFMSPGTVKVWVTAGDDRVCDYCKELNGTEVPWDADFPNIWVSTPPAHPHCRCGVKYIER